MKDAMFDLTGAPTITMETSDPKVWKELQEAIKNGYIAGAASKSNKNKPEAEVIYEEESKGDNSKVTDDHAFAILDIFDTRDSKGRDVRLLKIRNPWGKFDQNGNPDIKWEGNWAENSSLWTSNLKQIVSFGQEDGGVFFMDLEEFQKNFENVSICQIRDNFESTFRQINLRTSKWAVIEMKVAKSHKELFLTVSQKEKKHATSSFDFAAVKLILVQKDSRERLTYIGSKNNSGRQVFQVFENLQPGTYQVYVEVDTLQEVVLSSYSQGSI